MDEGHGLNGPQDVAEAVVHGGRWVRFEQQPNRGAERSSEEEEEEVNGVLARLGEEHAVGGVVDEHHHGEHGGGRTRGQAKPMGVGGGRQNCQYLES